MQRGLCDRHRSESFMLLRYRVRVGDIDVLIPSVHAVVPAVNELVDERRARARECYLQYATLLAGDYGPDGPQETEETLPDDINSYIVIETRPGHIDDVCVS